MGQVNLPPLARRALIGVLALDLAVAGLTVGLHEQDDAEAFSAVDAVEQFRASEADAPSGRTVADVATTATAVDPAGPLDGQVPPTTEPAAEPASPTPSAVAPAPTTPQTGTADEGTQPEPAFPAVGVYVYETTGFEKLDALGGSRHDYPSETTIVLRRSDCGITESWQPLEGRVDVRQLCEAPGRHRLDWYESTRSFFGQSDSRRLDCDDDASSLVVGAAPGDVYEFRCSDPNTDARNRAEVLGRERITIGGEAVEALRLRAVSGVTGDSRARSVIESWIRPSDGLTLKRVSTLDGTSPGPGGDVSYHEEYSLTLRSLAPRR